MVTAITALSASRFSATALNDLTSGSCELVTGSKSTGPTSPFGVWASAFAHRAASAFERYFALAALFFFDDECAAAIAFALRRQGVDRVDEPERIGCRRRRGGGRAACRR